MAVLVNTEKRVRALLGRKFEVLCCEETGWDERTVRIADVGRSSTARTIFDDELEKAFTEVGIGGLSVSEVVVGGGLHAAIYAATTEARTGLKVLVLESERVGGIFARCLSPAFYLNSRNRPSDTEGLPGTAGALNYIPNGIIQPADLNGREYQTNVEFAYAIRANLVNHAMCYRAKVESVELGDDGDGRKYYVNTDNGRVYADRVILATGAGVPRLEIPIPPDPNVYDFVEFLDLLDGDDQLPFRDWKNVAVIGAQDSGSSVIMALLGQGPMDPGPANFNAVERIDWYGQACLTKEQYEGFTYFDGGELYSQDGGSRSLYAGIGRYMPREAEPERYFRVKPIPERAYGVEVFAPNDVRVVYGTDRRLSRAYDHVVICAGFVNQVDRLVQPSVDPTLPENSDLPLRDELVIDPDLGPVAKRFMGTDIYKIGPCAELTVTRAERLRAPVLDRIPANSAAAFRYAPATRRLAQILHPA